MELEIATNPELASVVRIVVGRLHRRLRSERTAENLSTAQISALATLLASGATSISQLAALERVQPPSMTRIVEGLKRDGLVASRRSKTDGRQTMIEITDDGKTLLFEDRARKEAWLAHRIAELNREDRKLLERAAVLLDRLAGS